MSRLTKKPWFIIKCNCGDPLCDQWRISSQGSVGFDKPDAQLAASAPDLLEALQGLMPTIECMERHGIRYDPVQVDAARKAIAKALGEQA